MQPVSLSIIIPAKDEAENLPDLLDEIATSLNGTTYEIVVVDDGSSDTSWSGRTLSVASGHSSSAPRQPIKKWTTQPAVGRLVDIVGMLWFSGAAACPGNLHAASLFIAPTRCQKDKLKTEREMKAKPVSFL